MSLLGIKCLLKWGDLLQEQGRAGNFWFATQQPSDSVLPAVKACLVDSHSNLLELSPAAAMGEHQS